MRGQTLTLWIIVLSLAAVRSDRAAGMPADTSSRVGVLVGEIKVDRSGFAEMQQQTMAALPKKVRDMVAQQQAQAQTQQADASKTVADLQRRYLPGAIQRNFVQALAVERVPAEAIGAASPETMSSEGESKKARWLLTSDVSLKSSLVSGGTDKTKFQTFKPRLRRQLAINYSLADRTTGQKVIAGAQATCMDPEQGVAYQNMAAASSSEEVDSLWTECSRQIAKAVATALPSKEFQRADQAQYLPQAPPSLTGLRLNIEVPNAAASMLIGATTGKNDKAVLEFAGGYVATQQNQKGIILSPHSSSIFMVDDAEKAFSNLDSADFGSAETTGKLDVPGAKLVEQERRGSVVRYAVPALESMKAMGIETTVDIEFGAPADAWKIGWDTIKKRIGASQPFGFHLCQDGLLSMGVWQVLSESDAPPRRIVVRTAGTGKMARRMPAQEQVTTFDATEMPKAVDFTIPPNYHWQSSPFLNSAWF